MLSAIPFHHHQQFSFQEQDPFSHLNMVHMFGQTFIPPSWEMGTLPVSPMDLQPQQPMQQQFHAGHQYSRSMEQQLSPQALGFAHDTSRHMEDGQEARLRAIEKIAYEDHVQMAEAHRLQAAEMSSGILGAETYQDMVIVNQAQADEQNREKRRRLSREPPSPVSTSMSGNSPLKSKAPLRRKSDARPAISRHTSRKSAEYVPQMLIGGLVTQAPQPEPEHVSADELPKGSTERRRAQMRQAQRNYRQRREATITALETRNKQLEEVVDGMTKCFMSMQQLATSSDELSKVPELAAQLRSSTAEFLSWAKRAKVESGSQSGGSEAGGNGNGSGPEDAEDDVRSIKSQSPQPLLNVVGENEMADEMARMQQNVDLVGGSSSILGLYQPY